MLTKDQTVDIPFSIGNPCFIIGEVGQNHDGSLGLAHAFIDAIADAGADAVKFQTHIASAESTPSEPWRVKFSKQDDTRYEYWKRMEFTLDQWHGLKSHADDRGIAFMSTPFSIEAVDLLTKVGVAAWKVGSGETNNLPMLKIMSETGIPIILSTGMSTFEEIDASVNLIKASGVGLAVLQCTSAYPSVPEEIGLNVIPEYRSRYNCAVGLSDHSGKVYAGLSAATIGIDVLEVHVTLSRDLFGPDIPSSITTQELRQLVDGVRYIETVTGHPVNKDSKATELSELRRTFTKSIVARSDLKSETLLEEKHLSLKKPGTGIPASNLHKIIGRMLIRDISEDSFLSETDLAPID